MGEADPFETLVTSLTGMAKHLLVENGEFEPFGGVVDTTGKVTYVALDTKDEAVDTVEFCKSLSELLRKMVIEEDSTFVGICRDVRYKVSVDEKLDAIEFRIEDRSGTWQTLLAFYEKQIDGTIEFGEVAELEDGDSPEIFVQTNYSPED